MASRVENSVGFLLPLLNISTVPTVHDFFPVIFSTAHVLRLLATHHIIRERAPNIFTMNRISSLLDSGKSTAQLRQWESEGRLVACSFAIFILLVALISSPFIYNI
jgi:hypothetical protein